MTENKSDQFIKTTAETLEKLKDLEEISRVIDDAIKTLVPCDIIQLLSVDIQNDTVFFKDTLSKETLYFPLDKGGVLCQCYESHQPLLINDIDRSLLYNADVDGLNKKNIMKILVVPILDNNTEKSTLGMIWIGINQGYKQFIQKDIDELLRFANASKSYLFQNTQNTETIEKKDDYLLACQESQKMLQAKMQRNEDYFASTIHDIRTPMNAVLGFMELMLMNETNEEKIAYIDATLKSGEHMVALINDALDMSKVSSGKMSIDKALFSPIEGLGDISKLFYNSMHQKGIIFSVYIDPKLPKLINSDLHRIKQIVNNLLSNAMKFTPVEGKVLLECLYNKSKDILSISVIDTGIGVAKEKQKSIFSPYAQESNSTAKNYGGTGLGLSISQQLSILLNGKLTLESEQGGGSDFTFTLPCDTATNTLNTIDVGFLDAYSVNIFTPLGLDESLEITERYLLDLEVKTHYIQNIKLLETANTILLLRRSDALLHKEALAKFLENNGFVLFIGESFGREECRFKGNFRLIHHPLLPDKLFNTLQELIAPKDEQSAEDSIDFADDALKDKHILVIDDSLINLKLMSEILKIFHPKVQTFINPKEALEVLETQSFDMIFIDQNMPIMNGDEAIKLIRELEQRLGREASIIYALTGDEHPEINKKILEAGANGIYKKPIHIKEVHKAVLALLD